MAKPDSVQSRTGKHVPSSDYRRKLERPLTYEERQAQDRQWAAQMAAAIGDGTGFVANSTENALDIEILAATIDAGDLVIALKAKGTISRTGQVARSTEAVTHVRVPAKITEAGGP
jgi:hypothetical protein